jgi:hypothetical protein
LLSGVILWPWSDGIAQSYALFDVLIGTAAAAGAALICGWVAFLAVRRWPLSSGAAKGALWMVLGLCLAFGPALFALAKPLVKRRVARNESIAAIRFAYLKNALELARADRAAADSICAGQTLKKYYSGPPPFTKEDWIRISGNYMEEDTRLELRKASDARRSPESMRPFRTSPAKPSRFVTRHPALQCSERNV